MASVDKDINQHNAEWSFENISGNFASHIQKSIPFYQPGHVLVCQYSDFFLKPDSVVYDICCSTGQFLARLARHHPSKSGLRLIGIDTVEYMIGRAKEPIADEPRLSFVLNNALDAEFQPRGVVGLGAVIKLQMAPRPGQEIQHDLCCRPCTDGRQALGGLPGTRRCYAPVGDRDLVCFPNLALSPIFLSKISRKVDTSRRNRHSQCKELQKTSQIAVPRFFFSAV